MATAQRRAIYGKLAGDTTLNNLLATPPTGWSKSVYHDKAPETASYPFVVLSKSSGAPTEAFGVPAAFDTEVWLVKAVARDESADGAEAIAARVAALLNDANLSVSGVTLTYLRRQSDVQYSEVDDGVTYQHCGSLFRLVVT